MEVIKSKLSPVLPSAVTADNTTTIDKVEKPLSVSCLPKVHSPCVRYSSKFESASDIGC